jgi:methylenetetrahydrofolate reductase (NADPH)
LKIGELFSLPGANLSFEFFPPPDEAAEAVLFRDVVPALKQLGPRFFSVTYGAGGGTRDATLRIVQRIRKDFGVEAMSHLTCVGSTREMLSAVLDEACSLGIDNILCLRGDPQKGEKTFTATAGGFAHAVELIRFVKSRCNVGIGAACYPEGHIECADRKLDWDRAAAKVEAGADFLITQLFYDVRPFLEMEDYLRNKHRITVPIIPGMLPILSTIPPELMVRLEAKSADNEAVRKIGVENATEMCLKLLEHGVEGFHFYCLNRVPSVSEVVRNLNLAR